MRGLLAVLAISLGCGEAQSPQQTPAERFIAETQALDLIKQELTALESLKAEAEAADAPPGAVKSWKAKAGDYAAVKRAYEVQRKRFVEARDALGE